MSPRKWSLAAAMLLMPVVGACGGANSTPQTAANGAPPGFPVTIENCGRTLTFDVPPSRTLASTTMIDTFIELGLTDRVIGRTHFNGNLDALPKKWLPGYQQVPEVSKKSRVPVKEELLALRPDFVAASYYADFESQNGFATRDELAAVGIQSYIPSTQCDPASSVNWTPESTFTDVENLGKIFGVPDKAAQVVAGLKARIGAVEQRVSGLPPLRVMVTDATPDAFYAIGGRRDGGGTYTEGVRLAGGTNVFAENGYDKVNLEEVAKANADAYVVIVYPPVTAEQRVATVKAAAPNSPGVKDNRLAVVENNAISSRGIRVVDGIEQMAKVFHPEAFR